MNNHVPFVFRILAELWRLVAWTTRGFLAAVGADPAAMTALGALLVAGALLALTFPLLARPVIRLERWIARHVAEHHEQRELDQIVARVEPLYDVHDGDTQLLPGVTRILPPTVPLPTRKLQRRRVAGVRIPVRRIRRHHSNTIDSRGK